MRVNNNNTINPSQTRDSVQQIYPARSPKIRKVTLVKSEQGGASDHSGNVYVPAEETAYDRTVRFHESLHVDFTPKKFTPKDALDQGLEDARLHRYCSRSTDIRSVRRDEIVVALKDLRNAISKSKYETPTAITSLVVLRAVAILGDSKHAKLVDTAAKLIGTDYLSKVNRAIKLIDVIPGSKNWNTARRILHDYFSKDFEPKPQVQQPSSRPEQQDTRENSSELPDLPSQDTDTQRADSEKSDKAEDKQSESDSDSEKTKKELPQESEDLKSENPDHEDSDTQDTESSRELDKSDEPESSEVESGEEGEDFSNIIDVEKVKKPRPVKLHPDAYRGSAISKYDLDQIEANRLQQSFPKQLLIHRLDNGTDNVPTIQGNRGRTSSMSGSRINSGRLALAIRNNVRVFNHLRGEGGGAILIDKSGSMDIPESTLINFAANLPLATIAFYSAKDDRDTTKQGHLSVYAANGRRAGRFGTEVYGGYGNLVDYQAISWLMDQPGPRWYVGDLHFTGAWQYHCDIFFNSLVARKLVTHVRTLNDMSELLKRAK
jgi:hypothetical protein